MLFANAFAHRRLLVDNERWDCVRLRLPTMALDRHYLSKL
jgi:hypothetical protein